jgi:hypothetical protein
MEGKDGEMQRCLTKDSQDHTKKFGWESQAQIDYRPKVKDQQSSLEVDREFNNYFSV